MKNIYRCKAPLRIGLAGGGTDIDNYANKYGGVVLNTTISLYANCTIEPLEDSTTIFESFDLNKSEKLPAQATYPIEKEDPLILLKGVYNRVVKDFHGGKPLSIKISTAVDTPSGSGLGTSSTVVVCILKCFAEMLSLPLSEYDLAKLAYSIEREDLQLHGGKQDQYAATFGGFNFIEFHAHDKVIVNPLRVHSWIKNEIQSSLILYYMGKSHNSSQIIDSQINAIASNQNNNLEAMHQIKALSLKMKEYLLMGNIRDFELLFNQAWLEKKKTCGSISSPQIDAVYSFALKNGAISGKVSGAGGGGCFFFFTDPVNKPFLSKKLVEEYGGTIFNVDFVEKGAESWTIYQ